MATTPEQYDAIIIGSGETGKWMAWDLGSQGQRVINIEDKRIGGACPNVACLPSKNVVHSAKVAQYFQRGAEFGIVQGDWRVDMAGVNARRQKLVDGNLQAHLANYAKSHSEIVMGFGRFIAEKTVEVALNAGGTRTHRSDRIFLDTGSRATIESIPGLAESRLLRNVERRTQVCNTQWVPGLHAVAERNGRRREVTLAFGAARLLIRGSTEEW